MPASALIAIAAGVLATADVAAFLLRRGPSLGLLAAAVAAATITGAVYVAGGEVIASGMPDDERYYAMATPRFLFQGGGCGAVIGGVCSIVCSWTVLRSRRGGRVTPEDSWES